MQGQSVPTYNFRSVLLNGIARLKLPLRSRIWISPQAEAGATLGVADCVLLSLEYRLDAGRFEAFPAVSKRWDFDDRHGNIAFSFNQRYLFA